MAFRTWGGKRKGAGRKPNGKRAGVEHVTREVLKRRFPVHVTWRMDGAWNLRSRRCFTVLRRAMYGGAVRFGFRLVHYAVMGNHVHLIVEAEDRKALWRGMQGLGVRIAKGMNRLMGRTGSVLVDRYHAHFEDADGGAGGAGLFAAQRRGALRAKGRGSVCVAGRGGAAAVVVGGAVVVRG